METRSEQQPSPNIIFSLFSHISHRNILIIIADYLTIADLIHIKTTNKTAYNNMSLWLDKRISHPGCLYELLARVSTPPIQPKQQMSRVLQKYFYPESPYHQHLESIINRGFRPIFYATYALSTRLEKLDIRLLTTTINWLVDNNQPIHMIQSLSLIRDFLQTGKQQLPDSLRKYPLAYINLQGSDLSEIHLSNCNLSYANLRWSNLSNSFVHQTVFHCSDLFGATLTKLFGHSTIFDFASLQFTNMQSVNLSDASFVSANLTFANLGNSLLNRVNLTSARVNGANMKQVKLVEANAEHADFYRSNMSESNLQLGNFNNASFERTSLSFSNLFNASFKRANVTQTKRTFSQELAADFSDSTARNSRPLKARNI